jgi:RecA/RadA recombinase
MNLADKLKKNSSLRDRVNILADSQYLGKKEQIPTAIPAVNIAFSASPTGGFISGLTMIAGPSKHFKTAFGLLMMKSYLDKYPEGIALFYDSEFGTPQGYFDTFGIDTSRVVHTPITNLEEFKFDIVQQLKDVTTEDKLFIMVDSVGNLASKKEIDDAEAGKGTADMTRAKQFKSVFRMITPTLNMSDIPMIAINHTYDSQGLFPTKVVAGGTGMYYSADNIWIIGRQQEKEGTEIAGYNFIINVEKSRYIKEKSKIPVTVKFEGGIDKWSGLLDMALDAGCLSQSGAWYQKVDLKTGEVLDKKYRAKQLNTSEVWLPILQSETFVNYLADRYAISSGDIMPDAEVLETLLESTDD